MSDNYDGPAMAQQIIKLRKEVARLRMAATRLIDKVESGQTFHFKELKAALEGKGTSTCHDDKAKEGEK